MTKETKQDNPALAMIGKLTFASAIVAASLTAASLSTAQAAASRGGGNDGGDPGDPAGGPDTYTGRLDDTYQYTSKRCNLHPDNPCGANNWQVKGNW